MRVSAATTNKVKTTVKRGDEAAAVIRGEATGVVRADRVV